jgi:hypothetical protein
LFELIVFVFITCCVLCVCSCVLVFFCLVREDKEHGVNSKFFFVSLYADGSVDSSVDSSTMICLCRAYFAPIVLHTYIVPDVQYILTETPIP